MTDDLAQELDRTTTVFDDPLTWLATTAPTDRPPLAAEVWVFDPGLRQILLVRHRWRGWVPPGGKVEPGESPRAAAARELFEETGLRLELHSEPAAATVRCYQSGAPPTLGLSYVATAGPDVPLTPEDGQPVAWLPLAQEWSSWFPDDAVRVRAHAARLRLDDEQRTIAVVDISHRREVNHS